jgi:threonine dehydrogenase-like Zn-dependent dehydrogenase
MPLLTDADPLGVETFATHRIGPDAAPAAYRAFDLKRDGHVELLLRP